MRQLGSKTGIAEAGLTEFGPQDSRSGFEKCEMPTEESKAGASKPEILTKQFRRPAQGQSPVPFRNPATPGERLFAPKCL